MTTALPPAPAPPVTAAPDQVPPPSVSATRTQLRAAWAAARARNAFRHRALMATVSGISLVVSLLALILVPRQASRAARAALPQPGEKIDTVGAAAAEHAARQRLVVAESLVAAKVAAARARQRVVVQAPVVAAAAPTPVDPAVRDSLANAIAALERLQSRAQTSPLPSSYRALADAPELRGDPRVRALVDSLDDVEREREAFGVVSGVDPIYVSLTNRVTQLGRAIGAIAERRHAALRDELAAASNPGGAPAAPTTPVPGAPPGDSAAAAGVAATPAAVAPAPPRPPPLVVDTAAEAAGRDSARRAFAIDSSRLARVREQNLAIDRRVHDAQARANIDAPPAAMLVASLALAAVLGFAAGLGREVRRPLIADAREAERVTRTRVLAEIRPEPSAVDRARRRADVEVPDLIDPSLQEYRLLYLSLAATGAAVPVVTVIADEPAIAATVVANLAAVGAEDGRSTLVIDADLGRAAASVALGLGLRRGLAEVVRGTATYGDSLRAVTVGRGVAVDVLPAGAAGPAPTPEASDALRIDLARMAARYDFTVVSAASTEVERGVHSLLVAPDVIVCAHEGQTPVTRLAREIAKLRDLGATVRGIVLWDDEVPEVRTLAELRGSDGRRAA